MRVRTLRQIAATCVAASVLLRATAQAQQAQPPTLIEQFLSAERGRSLAQLVAAALEQSPIVLAARARVEAARGERLQAGLRPNPTLMSDVREEIGGSDRLAMMGLSWPMDLFRRPGRTDVADRGIEVAEHDLRNVERMISGDVRSRTIRLAAAIQELSVRQQVARILDQFRDLVAARAESGAAPPLERDMADVDTRRAAAEVLRQRAKVEALLLELKAVMGMQPADTLLLRESLEQLATSGDLSATGTAQAAADRADVQSAAAEVRGATARLGLIRLNAKPDVTLNTSYMRMSSGFPLFGLDATGTPAPIHDVFHNLSIGATVTLPLRDRRQGEIAAATARVAAAERNAQAVSIAASTEVAAARARVQRLDEALALYTSGLRDLASKNVEVMRGSYQLGRATLLDVLNETRRLLDTEMSYTDLLLEALQARSDLVTAAGVIR